MDNIEVAEEKLSSYLGVKHALLTSTGRAALVTALKALGISEGDAVILPSFTCDSVIKSIEFCGARPVFGDVDPLTFNVQVKEIKKNLSANTKAIVVIHCYGQPADMNEILEVVDRNNIPIIEDAAHSLGAEYQGEKVGSIGHFSIFSFSKNMNRISGGALVTNSGDLMTKAKEALKDLSVSEHTTSYLKHMTRRRLWSLAVRGKFILSCIKLLGTARKLAHAATESIPSIFRADHQVAVDVIKGLESIDEINEDNRRKARALTELINDLKIDGVCPPFERKDRTHVYYIYGMKVNGRERILEKLRKIEKYTFWSLPWQCPYGYWAKKLSNQLVEFKMNSMNENCIDLIVSALSYASKSEFNCRYECISQRSEKIGADS